MTVSQFKKLLERNKVYSNTLATMTDEEKASVKGGLTFRKVHQTDITISKMVGENKTLFDIVESGTY